MNVLGCPDGYTAELRTQGGAHVVAVLSSVTSVDWDRQLSATSRATVRVKPRTPLCAKAAAAAHPWIHELHLWRGPDRVWEGPVTDVADDGAVVTVSARDMSGWIPHRIVRTGYDTTREPADVADVARDMLADALGPGDPDIVRYLRSHPTGISVSRAVEGEAVMAGADLADLVALGLEWTCAGRRLHLFGGGTYPLTQIGELTGGHFAGALPVARAGDAIVTRVVVQGAGVRGEAGGVHPVIGLLERLDMSKATTRFDVDQVAQAGLYSPGLMVAGTATISLTARAPVTVGQLVAGAGCSVSGTGAALPVQAQCVLSKVSAQWTGGVEKVAVAFVELADHSNGEPEEQ